ncbi:tripartite tricarboxylate transporter substrate binding protein [Xanthobacteraceae bacterium Astr-EGSB]|uniref:Bug family tripartite tricarboxylate transporter substrate binding protein n=1 Tax=Astrobacterium formosum TaxID=3069710 RepID=UPI0027B743B2|nr:tripartite tricarboxylate transporter substrate binding protein [Xanthobacteraceae bacterium Astr-EGSB]
MKPVLTATICAFMLACPDAGHAQKYPAQSVRIVVPFAPGGATDIIARMVAARLSTRLGQTFVVENRGGGSGIPGTVAVQQARPDGYTLLLSGNGPHATNVALYEKLPYDPLKDFTQISLTGLLPLVLNVNPKAPFRTLPEFVQWAKANPGKMNYGSPGAGSPPHLAMEMLAQSHGLDMVHIPYKGSAPAITDLVAGHIPAMFDNVLASLSNIQSGTIVALGVTTSQRVAALPAVPTFREAGVGDFEASTWTLLTAPAGTPSTIVEQLSAEVRLIFSDPEIQQRLQQQGVVPTVSTPEQTQAFVASEIEKWTQVARKARVQPLDR